MNGNLYFPDARMVSPESGPAAVFGAKPASVSTAANHRLRRWLIIGLTAGFPITMISPTGGKKTNFAFSDIFMPIGVLLLVWFCMKGRLRLPKAGLFALSISGVSLSLLSNSAIYAQGGGTDVMILEAVKVLFLWIYFYLTTNLIQDRSDFLLVIKLWVLGSVAQALCGIYGSMLFQMTGTFNIFANWFRAQGTIGDCNLYAAHLSIGIFFTILYRRLTGLAPRWMIAAILLQFAGIIYSASRGGLLALCASLALLWMIAASKKQKVIGAAVVLGGLLLMLSIPNLDGLLGSNPITERLSTTTVNLDDPEARQRADLWNAAFGGFLTAPILGLGPGNFGVVGATLGEEGRAYVHNTLLEILCGTGIVGFASFIAFLAACLFGIVRDSLFNRDRDLKVTAGLLLCSFVALLLGGLTISIENYRGLWILLAILVAYQELYSSQTA